MSGFLAAGSGDWMSTESSAWVLTCFLRSWGRLNAFPQVGHLWGLRGTCTRMCEVMWSLLTVVVLQLPHWQVRFRLFVLFRPTWRSQMCSYTGQHVRHCETSVITHVESLGAGQLLLTVAPLTDQRLARRRAPVEGSCADGRGRSGGGGSDRRRRGGDGQRLLLNRWLLVVDSSSRRGRRRRGSRQIEMFRHCQEKSLVPFLVHSGSLGLDHKSSQSWA